MKKFLVVLAVSALLLAVLMLPLLVPIEPGRDRETRSMAWVQTAASAITRLASRAALGSYPPTSITKLRDVSQTNVGEGLGEGNELNRGIECVFLALHLRGVTLRLDLPDDAIANTDGDALERNVTRLDSAELLEIVDAWGNPLAYFRSDDYGKPDVRAKIRMSEELGGEIAEARPWRLPATGLFINPRSFQLFSAGADGVFNTADDLGNWERSRE